MLSTFGYRVFDSFIEDFIYQEICLRDCPVLQAPGTLRYPVIWEEMIFAMNAPSWQKDSLGLQQADCWHVFSPSVGKQYSHLPTESLMKNNYSSWWTLIHLLFTCVQIPPYLYCQISERLQLSWDKRLFVFFPPRNTALWLIWIVMLFSSLWFYWSFIFEHTS